LIESVREAKRIIKKDLGFDLGIVEAVCWLTDEEEGDALEENYCWECANQLRTDLLEGKLLKEFEKYRWKELEVACFQEQYESSGCIHCEECGVILDYCLIDCQSELEHFENRSWDVEKEDNWTNVLKLLEAVEHVERSDYP